MRAVDVIRKKRDGGTLNDAEIEAFVQAAAHGRWPDYQLSAMLMAIWLKGMTPAETASYTRAMTNSGRRYDWSAIPGPKADKHSTGGVGDKTSLILAPLAAACGVVVPMMSGRGLGHTGGTLDKLEAIPGFRVGLDATELEEALRTVRVGMIGQTAEVAPSDKKLYALRDVTSTVESIPLITGSILAKKLAEGIDALIMDVKFGRGAFMKTYAEAKALAESIVSVGNANGVHTEALLTAMDYPLGRTIGNALEVVESIETLQGKGPKDLEELSVVLAARMVRMSGLAHDDATAEAEVRDALHNGTGLEIFRRIIAQQGGDPRVVDEPSRLPQAPHIAMITAQADGYVTDLHAEKLGVAGMMLGAGRNKAEDAVDPAVGLVLQVGIGEKVTKGQPLIAVHYRTPETRASAERLIDEAIVLGDAPPTPQKLIHETIR